MTIFNLQWLVTMLLLSYVNLSALTFLFAIKMRMGTSERRVWLNAPQQKLPLSVRQKDDVH